MTLSPLLLQTESPAICAGGQCTNTPGAYLCTCEGGLLPDPDGPGCLGKITIKFLFDNKRKELGFSLWLYCSPLFIIMAHNLYLFYRCGWVWNEPQPLSEWQVCQCCWILCLPLWRWLQCQIWIWPRMHRWWWVFHGNLPLWS